MINLKDYHDLFSKCDVLLLADVFEIPRPECLHSSQYDPAYSWD